MGSAGNSFTRHLARIEFAKERTAKVFANFSLPMENAMASLSRAWEMLFDSLCTGGDGSMDELKDISAIIQKLSTSSKKIQEIELLEAERIAAADREMQKVRPNVENFRGTKLPLEIVETVEEQLQLL
jgi:hypothetical protein